jgi:hypothetical protein
MLRCIFKVYIVLAEETLPILGINAEVLLKFVERQLRK